MGKKRFLMEGMDDFWAYEQWKIGSKQENICSAYDEHKKRYSDLNLLGQSLKLQCQIAKTNFDKEDSIKVLKIRAKEVAEEIKHILGD